MSRPTVHAVGGYAPAGRLDGDAYAEVWDRRLAPGIQRVAVPAGDEDALSMAWEAARRAMGVADIEGSDLDLLAFATTTPPLEEEDIAVRLGSTLGVPDGATHHLLTGSTRDGIRALHLALEAGPWDENYGLAVAADAPRAAPDDDRARAVGAGAAAILLGPPGGGEVEAIGEHAVISPGERFRRPGSTTVEGLDITSYDRGAFLEAVEGAVGALGVDYGAVDAAAIQAPDGNRPYRVGRTLDLDDEVVSQGTVVHDLGDIGAACVPLGLGAAVRDGAESLLGVAYGSGAAATAILLDATDVPAEVEIDASGSLTYGQSLRRRGVLSSGPPEGGGAYVSLPSWRRTLPQRHRLVAGRCVSCGALTFPPDGACPDCGTHDGYEPAQLPGTGTVEAVTAVAAGAAPPEFDEQQSRTGAVQIAIVGFDGPGGDAVSAPVQVAAAPDESDLEVGDRVRATIRRLYVQEGVPRYAVKVGPASARG